MMGNPTRLLSTASSPKECEGRIVRTTAARNALRWVAGGTLLLATSCTPHVSGIVQDALTGRPVANARIELLDRGWGSSGGQLVWDADKISRTATDASGRFQFSQDGGTAFRVSALGYEPIETSLCGRSPMIVHIGGPHGELRADKRIFVGPDVPTTGIAEPGSVEAVAEEDLGIRVTGSALDEGTGLRVVAEGGIRFVEGTGAIPAAPPPPYDKVISLDVASDCGWLFVRTDANRVAVIQIRPIGWEQKPGGARKWVMFYTLLPSA